MSKDYLKAVKISDRVYWVGAVDWDERNFHGYRIERGTSYNAFLILDEKITLIDTVKYSFADELLARIASVVDPAKIDYIVSNHSEPDHSGALPAVIAAVKPEKVFASPNGVKNLKAHYGEALDVTAVGTGETLKLGSTALHFIETKMLHWPDSMFSYLDGEKILFSQDAFGMHMAGSLIYTDEYPDYIIDSEIRKYFANILLHLAPKVGEVIAQLPEWKLDIKLIAPDHGPLWRKNFDYVVSLYAELAAQRPQKRALVVYSTMWGSTKKLAKSVIDGIRSTGIPAEAMLLPENERSAVIARVIDAGLVVFGTPTLNNQMFPAVADVLCYLRGLRPKNRLGGVFGSYGWSGEGAKLVQADLEQQGFGLPQPPFQVKFVPTAEDLRRAFEFGESLGRSLLEKLESNEPENPQTGESSS